MKLVIRIQYIVHVRKICERKRFHSVKTLGIVNQRWKSPGASSGLYGRRTATSKQQRRKHMGPGISTSLDPLRHSRLTDDLQQMPTSSKLSPPDYSRLKHFFYPGLLALVAQRDKCLNASVDSDVYHLLPTWHEYLEDRIMLSASPCL